MIASCIWKRSFRNAMKPKKKECCGSVGRSSRWHRAYRKADIVKADGSSREEGVDLALSFHEDDQFGN